MKCCSTSSNDDSFSLWEGGVCDHYSERNEAENHGEHRPDHPYRLLVEDDHVHRQAEHRHPPAPEDPPAVVGKAVEDPADEGPALTEGGEVVVVVDDVAVLQAVELKVRDPFQQVRVVAILMR